MKQFLEGQEGSLKWTTEPAIYPFREESQVGLELKDMAHWDLDFCSVECLKTWLSIQIEREKLSVMKQILEKLDNLVPKV
jgi:DNA polymerase sigma